MKKFVQKDYKASDTKKKIDKTNNFDKADLPNFPKFLKTTNVYR